MFVSLSFRIFLILMFAVIAFFFGGAGEYFQFLCVFLSPMNICRSEIFLSFFFDSNDAQIEFYLSLGPEIYFHFHFQKAIECKITDFFLMMNFVRNLGLSWSNPFGGDDIISAAWFTWQRRYFIWEFEWIVHFSQRSFLKGFRKLYINHRARCIVLCSTGKFFFCSL